MPVLERLEEAVADHVADARGGHAQGARGFGSRHAGDGFQPGVDGDGDDPSAVARLVVEGGFGSCLVVHRVILNDGFQPIDRHLARFAKRGARRAAALEIEGPDGVAALIEEHFKLVHVLHARLLRRGWAI